MASIGLEAKGGPSAVTAATLVNDYQLVSSDSRRLEIRELHTLGPAGTNCEKAAYTWLRRQGRDGVVHLYPTLEDAVEGIAGDPASGLLACVVYPELHTLVFSNLHRLAMVDCFVLPTHNMVLALRPGVATPRSIASHPAPVGLIPDTIAERRLVNSNTQAAIDCARGLNDACITTAVSAREHGLDVIADFGPVPMGFSIHAPVARSNGSLR
jgi:prephenate dehydratase